MSDTLVIDAGEMEPAALLERLQDGTRVVVRTEFLGSEYEVALRYDGETYYCDTPTRLHKHTSEAEMQTCLEEQGYAEDLPRE